MADMCWVREIVDLDKEMQHRGYYLNKLSPVPVSIEVAKKYEHVIDITDLLRAITACEINTRYALVSPKEFDGIIYGKVFRRRETSEYLSYYWLWQIISEGSRGFGEAKGLVIRLIWLHLWPILHSTGLFPRFYRVAESRKKIPSKMKPLSNAISLSFELAYRFYRSKGRKDKSEFFGKGHLERQFMNYAFKNKDQLFAVFELLEDFTYNIQEKGLLKCSLRDD